MLNNQGTSISLCLRLLGATLLLSFPTVQAQESLPLEPGYTEFDHYLAVNTCMEYIYIQQYTDEPAEQDAFPLCQQRFLDLSRRLSHEQFVKQRQEQMNSENDYYQTLFGFPPKELQNETAAIASSTDNTLTPEIALPLPSTEPLPAEESAPATEQHTPDSTH